MFDVTSETRDNTSVIILKSRLTLQVILPARASLMTPSLIDDSALRNITAGPHLISAVAEDQTRHKAATCALMHMLYCGTASIPQTFVIYVWLTADKTNDKDERVRLIRPGLYWANHT